MSKKSEDFIKKMIEFFPSTKREYIESINKYGEVLETVVIEDIFMPQILKLFDGNENQELLQEVFHYFEEIVKENDSHLVNIFSITVLEILGNNKKILSVAKQYMGPNTTLIQSKADWELRGIRS